MIDRLSADKELIETAQYVIFRRISAEPGLKCAHPECIIPLSIPTITPTLLLVSSPVMVTMARMWLVTSLSRNIISRLERIREIRCPPPNRFILFLGH